METKFNGWVIINVGHPNNGEKSIFENCFAVTKRECIQNFIDGTGNSWRFWKDSYNFRCARCTINVNVGDEYF